ncbi:MAG: polymer-forming cytoskeletal protein [Patescibacteria group bacterium]|nr:polymer-forming cytoskeletal protein [Patescibacteria group bacterium]
MPFFKKRTMLSQVQHAETIVGVGVNLSGRIDAKQDIQVNGTFTGEIVAERDAIIGDRGEVNGPISAKNITVAGTVNGDINVVNELDLLPSGKIFGNISAKVLSIKPGGILNGKCVMHAETKDQKIVKPTYET